MGEYARGIGRKRCITVNQSIFYAYSGFNRGGVDTDENAAIAIFYPCNNHNAFYRARSDSNVS